MKKVSSKEKIKNNKKEMKMEDYTNNIVKGSDKVAKINLSIEEYGNRRDTFLILEKSFIDGTFLAFYKNTVVDMKTCKNPLTPWDFKQENVMGAKIKTLDDYCLVKRSYYSSKIIEDLSNTMTEEETKIQYAYDNKFLKIGNDEDIQYGDGGRMIIATPLYFIKHLPLNSNVKTNLSMQLNKLGDERNDWHEDCPVLDIIDPDLNPNYLSPTDMQKLLDEKNGKSDEKKNIKSNVEDKEISEDKDEDKCEKEKSEDKNEDKGEGGDDEDEGEEAGEVNDENVIHVIAYSEDEEENPKLLTTFPESLSLRSKYKWIPTEFLVNKDLKATILGPIHNLPRKGNGDIYSNILKVFEAMLPGFQKLNLLKENEDTKLQVVVKAQKYEIKPGMKYSGKWHMEGKTENIVAAGVYYCNIEKGFREDKLLFRNSVFPDETYAEQLYRTPDYEIDVLDGSAVVFSNTLPHKFKELANLSNSPITRTFLNFFIVDPSKPIECDSGKLEYCGLLKSMKLKNIVIGHILKFLSPLKYDALVIAKEKRRLARECMKTEVSGWGVIHYGNSGDLEFYDAFHEFHNPDKYDGDGEEDI